MKKGLVLFILLLSVNLFLVSAQDQPSQELDNVKKELNLSAGNVLNKEIIIPDNLGFFTRVVFGLSGSSNIDLQTFVVLIAMWIVLFLVIHSILEIAPFFGTGLKSWFGALVITILIALTGAIRTMALFFFGFGNLFGFLAKNGILRLILVLVILAFGFYVLFKLIKMFKHKVDLQEMVEAGYDVALERAKAKATREALKES